jgi:hypothetical protein
MALSAGPFALALAAVPEDDNPAYPGTAEIFDPGSDAAAALAARTVDWNANLLFDPNAERTQAEQRFNVLTGTSGYVWFDQVWRRDPRAKSLPDLVGETLFLASAPSGSRPMRRTARRGLPFG